MEDSYYTNNTSANTEEFYCNNCCNYCKLDHSEGEYYCSRCGLVAQNYTDITSGYPDSSLAMHYSDLSAKKKATACFSTSFSNSSEHSAKDFSGKKVSKSSLAELSYHQRAIESSYASLKQRTAIKGLIEVNKHCKALSLPKNVTDKVHETYKEFSASGYLKGRHILGSILALIVIVANSLDCPVAVAEVIKDNQILRRRFNKEFYHLYSLFKEVPKVASSGAYFQKYSSYIAPFPAQQLVKRDALKILETLNYESMQQRSAMVTVATILYYVLKRYRYPALEKFLKKIFINRLTIRNAWEDLMKIRPDLLRDLICQ